MILQLFRKTVKVLKTTQVNCSKDMLKLSPLNFFRRSCGKAVDIVGEVSFCPSQKLRNCYPR